MIVALTKIRRGKYHLVLKPKASSKREKKVVRAIALALCKLNPLIGSGPPSLGEGSNIYLSVEPNPPISEKRYRAAIDTHVAPPWNSAYEVYQGIALDRKIDDNLEYKAALRSEAIASQFGLHKIIPKSIRAKHTCRCGVSYKKRSKLHRHQEYCTVLAEERENFANIEAIKALVTPAVKKKVDKDDSESPKAKKKQSKVRQSLPDKRSSKKLKGKKATRISKR